MTSATKVNAQMTDAEAMEALYKPFPAEDHEFHPYHNFVYLKEEAINRRLTEVFGIAGWNKIIVKQEYIAEGLPTVNVKVANASYQIPLDRYAGETIAKNGNYFVKKIIEVDVAEFGEDNKPIIDEKTKKAVTKKVSKEVEELLVVTYDIPFVLTIGYMEVQFGNRTARRDDVGADILGDMGKERGARLHNTYKSSSTDLLKRLARQFGVGLYLTEVKKAKVKVVDYKTLAIWIKETYALESIITDLDDPDQKKTPPPTSSVEGEIKELTRDEFIAKAKELGYKTEEAIGAAMKAKNLVKLPFVEVLKQLPKVA